MASAAAGGAAQGVSHPRPNPSGNGGPRLRSSPAKGDKPVALADITNTGRPNATRSVRAPDVSKMALENAKLLHVLTEKTKFIELTRVEIQKLHLALQSLRMQNLQLAQTNSQMLGELNTAKDRIKILQHELSCKTALLKVKDSEAMRKNKAEPPQEAMKKRDRNKRKSESSECIKDINIMQDSYKPHLEPIISLDHEDLRKPQRRRSSRLNQGSCEINGVSHNTLHVDTVDPLAPSSVKSLQNECSSIAHEAVMSSESDEIEINDQQQQEVNLKEIQEACSRVTEVEAHKTSDKGCNTKQNYLVECQSSVPFDVIEPPKPPEYNGNKKSKPPEDNGNKRGSNKQKLASCESVNYSAIDNVNAKYDTTTSDPLPCEKKRRSARLNLISSEDTTTAFEARHEDLIASLATSSLNDSMEQKTNQKQSDACSSLKSTEGQVAGRRSLRRAAEKVVSYKEIPLNVKMRRP